MGAYIVATHALASYSYDIHAAISIPSNYLLETSFLVYVRAANKTKEALLPINQLLKTLFTIIVITN